MGTSESNRRGGVTIRGPQVQTVPPVTQDQVQSQSQGQSQYQYQDQSQYANRGQELARMMDNIRAEQEELERSRLEHGAQMRVLRS